MPNINPFAQKSADDGSVYVIGIAESDSEGGFVEVAFSYPEELPEDGSDDVGDDAEVLELVGDDDELMVTPDNLSDYDEDPELYSDDDDAETYPDAEER